MGVFFLRNQGGPGVDLGMDLGVMETLRQRLAPRRVFHNALFHEVQAHPLDPGGSAFQIMGILPVQLQEGSSVFGHLLGGFDVAEQVRRAHLDATIAAHMQLVA